MSPSPQPQRTIASLHSTKEDGSTPGSWWRKPKITPRTQRTAQPSSYADRMKSTGHLRKSTSWAGGASATQRQKKAASSSSDALVMGDAESELRLFEAIEAAVLENGREGDDDIALELGSSFV